MAGLHPAIQIGLAAASGVWIAGSSPAMTSEGDGGAEDVEIVD
jgi:hypothetical protein